MLPKQNACFSPLSMLRACAQPVGSTYTTGLFVCFCESVVLSFTSNKLCSSMHACFPFCFCRRECSGQALAVEQSRLSLVSLPHHVFSTVVDELQPNKPNTAVLECTVWHFMHWWTLLGICDHAAVWCG
jgi:hypothetical protein